MNENFIPESFEQVTILLELLVVTSVVELEPPESYHFDPARTGTVSLL
jgi:hypothetical protein